MRPQHHPASPRRRCRAACGAVGAALLAAALAGSGQGRAAQPLDDAALRQASAGQGMRFDVSALRISGDARLTYTTPDGLARLYGERLDASRSDDPGAGFSDPYALDITRRPGAADVLSLSNPANAQGRALWRLAIDVGVQADGSTWPGGSLLWRDLALQGGGWQWRSPALGDGLAWGGSVRLALADGLWLPRGRDAAAWDSPGAAAEQWRVSGLRVGAAPADGGVATIATPITQPWRLADLDLQPGIVNVVADATGTPRLHLGIAWPTGHDPAATGTLLIDKLVFQSAATGTLDLGASSIGGLRIQYLDLKFKP